MICLLLRQFERRLRTRLIMFHKVINENIAIPTQNILLQSQSTTRSSQKDSYRQIQCNKDSYKFSFFCQTIKDWNKLSPDITKNTTTESFKGGCFRLCEDPKQCSSILIWVLLGFDMLVLLSFVIVLLDFF
jgi:hypothetical protein